MKIIPNRKIAGYSAILLPFKTDGAVDWEAFCVHLARTSQAGLVPAVNMDTGYANVISEDIRQEVLRQTQATLAGAPFTAGAFVSDNPGDPFISLCYTAQIESILTAGGMPVVMQSFGLTGLPPDLLIDAYAQFGRIAGRFIAFELGEMFAPFGAIYDLEIFAALLGIPECIALKHSSLNRQLEWERLALRDRLRQDFLLLTGNDLAIDMVMYGSDYLLGLSTFAPDYFALRDRYWYEGDPRFYELNDILQYLGAFAFRKPIPAYKHSAAQFLKLRGWIGCDQPHPDCPRRPESDKEILQGILDRLALFDLDQTP